MDGGRVIVARLEGLLAPVGLAWMPEGVLVATTDGGYVRWTVVGDGAGGWEERVRAGLESGAAPRELVAAWTDEANGVTWGVEAVEFALPEGVTPDDVFGAESTAVEIERAEIEAGLEAAGAAALPV